MIIKKRIKDKPSYKSGIIPERSCARDSSGWMCDKKIQLSAFFLGAKNLYCKPGIELLKNSYNTVVEFCSY